MYKTKEKCLIDMGSKWLCIKTYTHEIISEIVYASGKVYKSEEDETITGERGIKLYWRRCDLSEYFKPIPKNKRCRLQGIN